MACVCTVEIFSPAVAREADADDQSVAVASGCRRFPSDPLVSRRRLAWLERQLLNQRGAAWRYSLVNGIDASAGRVRSGAITWQGSPRLRWALVEAVIHAMKPLHATGRWARRLAGRTSICPARFASAPVLCRDIVRVWRTVE